MKIEVNIQAPELVSAINNLANAMGSAPVVAPVSEPKEDKKKATSKKTDKPKSDDKSAKTKETDKPKADEPKQETEIPSVEDVRAKTAEAAKVGKKAEIKALLDDFGVNAVSKIPEDKRADYLTKLESL